VTVKQAVTASILTVAGLSGAVVAANIFNAGEEYWNSNN
jgi:hypothetical protein